MSILLLTREQPSAASRNTLPRLRFHVGTEAEQSDKMTSRMVGAAATSHWTTDASAALCSLSAATRFSLIAYSDVAKYCKKLPTSFPDLPSVVIKACTLHPPS